MHLFIQFAGLLAWITGAIAKTNSGTVIPEVPAYHYAEITNNVNGYIEDCVMGAYLFNSQTGNYQIIHAGGWNPQQHGVTYEATDSVYVSNDEGETFSFLGRMPGRAHWIPNGVVGNKFYLFGKDASGNYCATWIEDGAIHNLNLPNLGPVYGNDRINPAWCLHKCADSVLRWYIAGGSNHTDVIRTASSVPTDQWTVVGNLGIEGPTARLISLNGKLYHVGGNIGAEYNFGVRMSADDGATWSMIAFDAIYATQWPGLEVFPGTSDIIYNPGTRTGANTPPFSGLAPSLYTIRDQDFTAPIITTPAPKPRHAPGMFSGVKDGKPCLYYLKGNIYDDLGYIYK